jgi:hypothetical protein
MTRGEARAFRARWQAVNAAERRELQTTPAVVRFRQLAALMASSRGLGWDRSRSRNEDVVRRRWNRLRRAQRG